MSRDFNPKEHVDSFIEESSGRRDGIVLTTVSGGVDSTTSAMLLQAAGVESRVVYIDTGFMREGETESVVGQFKDLGIQVEVIWAQERFYSPLAGVSDPVKKREVFRIAYFEIMRELLESADISAMVQGTQFRVANTGKIYHNCPPQSFEGSGDFEVIEPVRGLVKSEVRAVASYLGLPKNVVERRPFPGPGLLLRFGGSYSPERLQLIRSGTRVVDDFVEEHREEFSDCYQIFPFLCDGEPVTYVDANGGGALGSVVLVRAVEEQNRDGMIAYERFMLDLDLERTLVSSLMDLPDVARVCFDSTPKIEVRNEYGPGATIEYI